MTDRACSKHPATTSGDRGSMLTTLLIVMVPLLMLVTAATTVLTGRKDKLLRSVQEQKALLGAAAGIELAAQSAQAGSLRSDTVVETDLQNGVHCSYVATYLGSDGEDNDEDTQIDEADERAFEVVAEGRHGVARRRVSAVLIEPAPLPNFAAAILALGMPDIVTDGSGTVSGLDTRIDGRRGLAANDVNGIDTEPPHTAAELLANYTRNGIGQIVGRSGVPSLGVIASPYNLPGLTATTLVAADLTLPSGTYSSSIGNARTNDWRVTYCPGDLHLSGNNTGAGVLLVTGDLEISGSWHFDGLIIVLGELTIAGSSIVNGAVIQGPEGSGIKVAGSSLVRYSAEAVGRLNGMIPRVFTIDAWREVSR